MWTHCIVMRTTGHDIRFKNMDNKERNNNKVPSRTNRHAKIIKKRITKSIMEWIMLKT